MQDKPKRIIAILGVASVAISVPIAFLVASINTILMRITFNIEYISTITNTIIGTTILLIIAELAIYETHKKIYYKEAFLIKKWIAALLIIMLTVIGVTFIVYVSKQLLVVIIVMPLLLVIESISIAISYQKSSITSKLLLKKEN